MKITSQKSSAKNGDAQKGIEGDRERTRKQKNLEREKNQNGV